MALLSVLAHAASPVVGLNAAQANQNASCDGKRVRRRPRSGPVTASPATVQVPPVWSSRKSGPAAVNVSERPPTSVDDPAGP